MAMLVRFSLEVGPLLEKWERRLRENPADLETIEQEVCREYQRGSGLLIAGLVSVVMQTRELAEASEQTRREFCIPLAKGRNRTLAIRLLGGVIMWATSLYCERKRGPFRKTDDGATGCISNLRNSVLERRNLRPSHTARPQVSHEPR